MNRMKVELFQFQKKALSDIRSKVALSLGIYQKTHAPQVISVTAPTGAGKTIIMAALIESILYGDENFIEQPNAVIVWLSDSPQLNEQSKLKIDAKADKVQLSQTVTIEESSFDRESFEDGHIYFLNTQKLSASSKLTKAGDGRAHTIWQTFANTVREKSDRFYLIIDEAHRGMHGRDANRATSIMQKFIKGSLSDGVPPMPVVIGMSATTERFNRLVEGTTSTIHKCLVTAEDVRSSGLLKDRIVITYPEEDKINNDMAILQAAADDWKEKWEHWKQYCFEQHYAYVNPVFIVQVLNGTAGRLTDTNLNDCLRKIEERTDTKFVKGQVVHTFGQTSTTVMINGLEVPYEEPSRIAENKNIELVFFKENLSTGWDCPRAETMMSFKHASDATYIAQLLGRMIRTPMHKHIEVDDVLNDVHLYLPYFNKNTVKDIVEALQTNEGGSITDIQGRSLNETVYDTWTVSVVKEAKDKNLRDTSKTVQPQESVNQKESLKEVEDNCIGISQNKQFTEVSSSSFEKINEENENVSEEVDQNEAKDFVLVPSQNISEESNNSSEKGSFDRQKIVKYINQAGLLNYCVRSLRINDYLKSLFKMAHLLTMTNIHKEAIKDIQGEIVQKIHQHIELLKKENKYQNLVQQVKQFKLASQIFDAFGETVDNYLEHDLLSSTDIDIDRQFSIAERKLGSEGIGKAYVNNYLDNKDPSISKIDVILFVADDDCMNDLHTYAEDRFHEMVDKYRKPVSTVPSERVQKQLRTILADGDCISQQNFRLPETIHVPHEVDGKDYSTHLFINGKTGVARIKLNQWELEVIKEEEQRDDFVCWIRNPPRASWALCVPYMINGEVKPTYPDFIIVRKEFADGYAVDILEPHSPDFKDNLGKAKGLAEYARQNNGISRIQLIRVAKDAMGKKRLKRLDLGKSAIREKVSRATTNEELDHIFEMDSE